MPLEYAGTYGAGAATGAINPKSTWGKIAAGLAGGVAGTGTAALANAFGPGRMKNFIGRSALTDTLNRGKDFTDIDFGRLSKSRINEINAIRKSTGEIPMTSRRATIPANVISKWSQKRIANDGLTPKEMTSLLQDVLHGKTSTVSATKLPQNQALVNMQDDLARLGFLSVNPKTGKTVVKSAYQTNKDNVEKALFGSNKNVSGTTPSPFNEIPSWEAGSRGGFTALSDNNIIPQSNRNVNLNDLVGDNKSYKTLRKGIRASDDIAEDIQHRVADALEFNQRSTVDNVLKEMNSKGGSSVIDRFDAAKEVYSGFMRDHGNTKISGYFRLESNV